jgi:Asp/Glu/hydantoin racemase
MAKRVALIHTLAANAAAFKPLTDEILPGVETFNVVDESLLQETIRAGAYTPAVARRFCSLAVGAQEAGADAILLTCSSISPCADLATRMVSVPVLKVDEAMADAAVERGKAIGVIATLGTTLGPTSDLITARAALQHKEVRVTTCLCPGAFDALKAGNHATHDQIVLRELKVLMTAVDVVVLAQASMARALDQLKPEEKLVPILTSPRMGVERLAKLLGDRETADERG